MLSHLKMKKTTNLTSFIHLLNLKKCTISQLLCNILVEKQFSIILQKDGDFAFWSMSEQMIIFLVSKNHSYPPSTLFWDTL